MVTLSICNSAKSDNLNNNLGKPGKKSPKKKTMHTCMQIYIYYKSFKISSTLALNNVFCSF